MRPPWTPDRIAATLNLLDMVRWDRMITVPYDDAEVTTVYGWVDIDGRDDGRADFVVVDFASWSETPGYSTSSAARSAEINTLLYGPEQTHHACVPVEESPVGELVSRKVWRDE